WPGNPAGAPTVRANSVPRTGLAATGPSSAACAWRGVSTCGGDGDADGWAAAGSSSIHTDGRRGVGATGGRSTCGFGAVTGPAAQFMSSSCTDGWYGDVGDDRRNGSTSGAGTLAAQSRKPGLTGRAASRGFFNSCGSIGGGTSRSAVQSSP